MHKNTNFLHQWTYVVLAAFFWLMYQTEISSRPLNPSPRVVKPETPADRYFRIAFDSGGSGDFDSAAINYRRAALASSSSCDRLHAKAGEKAALEMKELKRVKGSGFKVTQVFASRLEDYTAKLPCVTIRRQ